MGTAAGVHVHQRVIDTILTHARDTLPNECCGLLIGAPADVARAWPARNATPGPSRYSIDPEDHFAAIRAARADGHQVVGGYHSHPTGSLQPSDTDRREAQPDFLYFIASPVEARVEAWMFAGQDLRPERLPIRVC